MATLRTQDECPSCGSSLAYHGVITEPGECNRFACDDCGHVEETESTRPYATAFSIALTKAMVESLTPTWGLLRAAEIVDALNYLTDGAPNFAGAYVVARITEQPISALFLEAEQRARQS